MTQPLVDVSGRRREKERLARRRRLRVVAAVLAVLGAVAGLGWVVWGSPLLVVREVQVSGTSLLTTESVVQTAAVPLGVPLARIPTEEVAERVRTLAAVASVEVRRVWPRSIHVAVTERQLRLVRHHAGSFEWVDDSGTIFHATAEQPDNTMLAEVPADAEDLLADIVIVANALPPQVRERVTMLRAGSVDSIEAVLADGGRIVWGSAEASGLKSQIVVALLQVPAGVYDVSSPSNPTTRVR